ncbi:MAG TPA: hypothetical protein PLZ36_13050 [Armatimonadota bacterium]|nr:hypothetical protein [Armatimonadota bacterium]HOS43937.1 hypothetical protein [Armatimonadota bacterium]
MATLDTRQDDGKYRSRTAGESAATLPDAPRLHDAAWKRLGEDGRVEGYVASA